MAKPTLGEAVRSFCLECLGAERTSQAFDCQSRECPLYVCCPFRGREVPHNRNPEPSPQHELEQAERVHRDRPKRRPSRALVREQCDMCLPPQSEAEHCEHMDCPLYPFTHRRPGGPVKARRSTAQSTSAQASLQEGQKSPKPGPQ